MSDLIRTGRYSATEAARRGHTVEACWLDRLCDEIERLTKERERDCKAAEDNLDLIDEFERIQSELPETRDLVLIVPRMIVWRWEPSEDLWAQFHVDEFYEWGDEDEGMWPKAWQAGVCIDSRECYSTNELEVLQCPHCNQRQLEVESHMIFVDNEERWPCRNCGIHVKHGDDRRVK